MISFNDNIPASYAPTFRALQVRKTAIQTARDNQKTESQVLDVLTQMQNYQKDVQALSSSWMKTIDIKSLTAREEIAAYKTAIASLKL